MIAELTILLSTVPEGDHYLAIQLIHLEDGSAELHTRSGCIGAEPKHAVEAFSTTRLAQSARAALIASHLRRGYVRAWRHAHRKRREPLSWEAHLACALERMTELAANRDVRRPTMSHSRAQLALPL